MNAAPEHVVGIGASAGGIEALGELLSRFKHDATSFVVVTHLSPDARSFLAEILQRSTSMAVQRADKAVNLIPNYIYVSPPGVDLTIQGNVLAPVQQRSARPRWSIDRFFADLAYDRRAQAVGIVLSGSGRDGAAGLAAIRAGGGKTFCQTPESAQFEEMPRSAQASADFCLSPAELGDQLMRSLGIV